ncbi:hypothetical protein GGR54DRAFT_224297 [Hypoxylon sp. NC1633]|nr:hypothetical protein GGR54DRAFT_224297 [Hypoxylon sp. NC1633]
MAIMKSILQLCQPSNVRVSPTDSRDNQLDILSRLPFELHVLILDYFGPADVDAGLSACRYWRDIWLSDEIWPKLAQRWFPGLEEHIRRSSLDGQEPGEAFRRALHKIERRGSGRFASALHHDMRLKRDPVFTLTKNIPRREGGVHSYDDMDGLEYGSGSLFPRFMLYSSGRIAWWPEAYAFPYFAIVDDLRTRKRRAYQSPNNNGMAPGFRTAMSDKLFLLGQGAMLYAWHLELDQPHSIKVPEEFVRCIAEGETVLILSKHAEVYLWKFGNQLRHIRLDGCFEKEFVGSSQLYDFYSGRFISRNPGSRLVQSGTLLDFIISPTEEDVFFVVTFSPSRLHILRVDEIRRGQLIGSYGLDRNQLTNHITVSNDFTLTNLRWEKVDFYGGYCLTQASFPPQYPRPGGGIGTAPDAAHCDSQKMGGLLSVCFNIYTKSFTIPHYHHKECHDQLNASLIWNNRILSSDPNYEGPVLSLHPCGTIHPDAGSQAPPLYTTIHSGQGSLSRRRRAPFDELKSRPELVSADFALDPYRRFSASPTKHSNLRPSLLPGSSRLVGDDDFLLLFDKTSYTAWSFGDEIPEKKAGSERSVWRSLIH